MNVSTDYSTTRDDSIDWWTLGGSGFFYIIVLAIGIISSKIAYKFQTGDNANSAANTVMVGNRDFGWFISICTISATYIGAAAVVASPERTYHNGVVSGCLFGFSFSAVCLFFAGVLFGRKIRESNCVTFIEIFQNRYGIIVGSLFSIPAFVCELMCVAATLSALGTALAVMANIEDKISIIVSAVIAISYTFFGGIFSVAYTDIVQLAFIIVGVACALPYALTNEAVHFPTDKREFFLGKLKDPTVASVMFEIDSFLSLTFGAIAWQCLMQRVLAARNATIATYGCIISGFVATAITCLPLTMGAIARATGKNLPFLSFE